MGSDEGKVVVSGEIDEAVTEEVSSRCAATASTMPPERAMAEQHSGLDEARNPSRPPAFCLAT